jgi:hypothetical protein
MCEKEQSVFPHHILIKDSVKDNTVDNMSFMSYASVIEMGPWSLP